MAQIEGRDAAKPVALLALVLVALKARFGRVGGASVGDEDDNWRGGEEGRFDTFDAYIVSARDAPASAALAWLGGRFYPADTAPVNALVLATRPQDPKVLAHGPS